MNHTITLRDESAAARLWTLLRNNWRAMADAGKPLAVTVAEAKSKRSTSQNARYWARLSEIAEQAWVDGQQFRKEAWHEHFSDLYAPKREITLPSGEIRLVRTSTTDMNTIEFNDYMMRVDLYAAQELGLEYQGD